MQINRQIWQANSIASWLLLGVVWTGWCESALAATVTRGPYLQLGTPSSIVVRWRTDAATDSEVRYGAAPGNLGSQANSFVVTTEHEITVGGLTPDTQYYYSVGTTATILAGDNTDHFFITFPPVGTPEPTRIWVLGDSGTANGDAAAVRDAYFTATGSRHTDIWLMLGDNAYSSGTDAEYQNAVFNMYPTMLRKSVLWPTLGNHDGISADSSSQTGPYYSIFTLPKQGEAGGVASGTEAYYSFDFGNIHFICLESYETDRATNAPMANWLRSDLGATTRDWIVAFWHHPPYSKGSHDSDTETELIQMRENFLPILEAGGVDLVLGGHSHSYERSFLIDGHYGLSTTFNDSYKKDGGSGRDPTPYQKPAGLVPHQGAVYTVAGSSGQTAGGTLNHPAMFISLNVLGSLVLDFQTNRLDLSFLNSSGVVQDDFTIVKGASGPPPVPLAPTGLTAAPGDGRVALTWNASSGATSYNVKRSADSGVTYATIAPGVTTTSHTDTTVANGTTYYYKVSAVNAAGESSDSTAVSATPQPSSPPVAPTGLTAKATGKRKISLNWKQSTSPNVTQNKIYRSATSGGTYGLIATIPAAISYNNAGLTSGTIYYYVVTAVNSSGGESPFSNPASATSR